MPKRVYLHIGWEKTGTSAIQAFCARNQRWLNTQGIHYPLMGEIPQHIDLYYDLISGSPSRIRSSHDAIRAEIDRCEHDSMIFSHESLHLCKPELFAHIFQGCDVRIIAYIRRPDAAFISFFVTMARFGLIPIHDLSGSLRAFSKEHLSRFEYEQSLAGFASQFGREQVTVRHYARDELVGGQTLTDFMHQLGINNLEDSNWPEEQSNLSLDADQFAIVLQLAKSLHPTMPGSQICELTRELCDAMILHAPPDRTRSVECFVPVSLRRRLLSVWQDSFPKLYNEYFDAQPIFDDDQWVQSSRPYQGISPERLDELTAVVRQADALPPQQIDQHLESLLKLQC